MRFSRIVKCSSRDRARKHIPQIARICRLLRIIRAGGASIQCQENRRFSPRRFQLTMRPSTDKGAFLVRTLDPKVGDSPLMASMSSWKANLDGTLHIVWSTGYVGYDVRLSGSGPELRGTAHYFTDTDPTDTDPLPRINHDTAVVAQRVGCKESEK